MTTRQREITSKLTKKSTLDSKKKKKKQIKKRKSIKKNHILSQSKLEKRNNTKNVIQIESIMHNQIVIDSDLHFCLFFATTFFTTKNRCNNNNYNTNT